MSRPKHDRPEVNRPERAFQRRRCPKCGCGLYKRLHQAANPNLRECDRCAHVFHLHTEGVQEGVAAKAVVEKSGVVPVPCREREFKPLRRDPFEHQRLAMTTR